MKLTVLYDNHEARDSLGMLLVEETRSFNHE